MGKIIILDENTANKIAAGEVIERPASVIKELVENSIDAGATSINVEIRNGGISFLRVIDNGSGLAADDVEIAFERHATSKIRRADDLENLSSMGFRGEALASIAAVSSVQLSTRTREAVQGVCIDIKGGNVMEVKPAGCPTGTSITVRELFFNTPARYKFLKKDTTEASAAAELLSRIALGYPDISVKLVSGGAVMLHTPGNGDLKSAIFSVYGAETAKQLIEVNYDDGRVKISGYIGKAEISRSNRNQQSVYINRRIIRSKTISAAIDAAYATFLMKNRYAFALLDIRLNQAFVDVNVHPSKMEVKFSNEQDIYRAVYHAVNAALLNRSEIRTLPGFDTQDRKAYNLNDRPVEKPTFTQQSFEHSTSGLSPNPQRSISDGMLSSTQRSFGGHSERPSYEQQSSIHKPDKSESQTSNNFGQTTVTPAYSAKDFEPVRKELEQIRANAISENFAEANAGYGAAKIPAREDGEEGSEIASEEFNTAINEIPGLFSGSRVIGQAFSTYILLERGDELLLLDQHAAHERIRYEELKAAFKKGQPIRQMLLSVISMELSASEYEAAMNETEFFESLGFTYESFGTNSIILRSVPFEESGIEIRELFLEILDFVISEDHGQRNTVADEVLYQMACKSAVKANKKLDEKEIEALLDGLAALENPYTCPHGRPAILKLRKYELEKLFKRIV